MIHKRISSETGTWYTYPSLDNPIGQCNVIMPDKFKSNYNNKKTAYIGGLWIDERYRGNGHGIMLLNHVLSDLYDNGVRYVEVHDVSDFAGQMKSIYVKAGLRYVSDDNYMRGNLRHLKKMK